MYGSCHKNLHLTISLAFCKFTKGLLQLGIKAGKKQKCQTYVSKKTQAFLLLGGRRNVLFLQILLEMRET